MVLSLGSAAMASADAELEAACAHCSSCSAVSLGITSESPSSSTACTSAGLDTLCGLGMDDDTVIVAFPAAAVTVLLDRAANNFLMSVERPAALFGGAFLVLGSLSEESSVIFFSRSS